MKHVIPFLTGLAVLPGCALLEQGEETGGPQMMMTADMVPLVPSEQRYERGEPMAVPEEPPPFPVVKGRHIGMQSDLEAAGRARKGEDEPQYVPREPIP